MNIVTAHLAWTVLAIIAAARVLAAVQEWLHDRYEAAWAGRRLRVARRWYGTGAHVVLRDPSGGEAGCYCVVRWDDEGTAVPWVLAENLGSEDAEPFWAPVTGFAPLAVRKFPFGLGYRPAPAR